MSKRKRKNAITLISLLLTLVVLIGFYLWYVNKDKASDHTKNAKETEQEEKELVLTTMDPDKLTSLHMVNAEADLQLVKDGDTWKSETDPNRPINQTYVNNMINLIDEIKAERIINESVENLEEYGLKDPDIYVSAEQADGKSLTLQFGIEAIGGKGYYALVNQDNKVYLLNTSYGVGFNYSDIEMTAVEPGPTINTEHIHHIVIENRDGNDFELLYDPENKLDYTPSDMFSWVILKPYEEGYLADGSKVSELLGNYGSFQYNTCVDYQSEELGKYGLEDPVASLYVGYYEYYTQTLDKPETDEKTGEEITEKTYYDTKEYKIYVGNSDGNGNYYVRKEGSNAVYTMKATEVDKMLHVDAFSIMSSFIILPNIETVNRIDIEIDGIPYTMEIERIKEKNEDGEEETKSIYYYNGREVEEDIFKDVYQVMIAAAYDAEMKEEINAEGIKPFLTISYHIVGNNGEAKVLTASYLPYDDSFYLIRKGEEDSILHFFADKRKIDKIANAIKEFKAIEN
ncbi:DUF4340 domain-containing protein [Mobilitalea sibirica]|uniref:DUF4340 domain-containing protein n=1 Tax=Mobilitalea sibirica TaxID=1462919 RepID=A0A8J7H1I8_9FIRM|nr:DUF4340 domain-containing protein [Mobilitalea sibirica]MBH1940319.1 DUF4340 domain-containing protein [Mobilitalea sibirica]